MSTAYLARWSGPAAESDDPYDDASCTSPPSVPIRKHLKDVYWVPNGTSPTDNEVFKNLMMTYGAVTETITYDPAFLNPSTHAYYNPGYSGVGHEVTAVGWDDNYPASNFHITPPGDGAVLAKNSWGGNWGDSGYFWISYYEWNSVGGTIFVGQAADSGTSVYQYDPLGLTLRTGCGVSNTSWGANMFTATATHYLWAASTYFLANNIAWELYVYTGCTPDAPRSGILKASKSGTMVYAGYHTITLSSPVALTAGDLFSIVFKLTSSSFQPILAVEHPGIDSSAATASPGQSFYGCDGSFWGDMTSKLDNTNVCIKGFGCTKASCAARPVPGNGATGVSRKPTISWDPVSGATSYDIYGGTSSPLPYLANKTVTSYTLPITLDPGTKYYWQVRPKNICGDAFGCSVWSFTTCTSPSAPAGVTASTNRCTDVQVTWNAVSGATGYKVMRGSACGTVMVTFAATSSPYYDATAEVGTSYQYWIAAVNACGAGASSSCALGIRPCGPPPETAPGGSLSTAQTWTDKNTHKWPSNSQATSYKVYRGTRQDLANLLNSNMDSCTKYSGTATSIPITDNPVGVTGRFYWYLVTGSNSYGEGTAGNATAGQRTVNASGGC